MQEIEKNSNGKEKKVCSFTLITQGSIKAMGSERQYLNKNDNENWLTRMRNDTYYM